MFSEHVALSITLIIKRVSFEHELWSPFNGHNCDLSFIATGVFDAIRQRWHDHFIAVLTVVANKSQLLCYGSGKRRRILSYKPVNASGPSSSIHFTYTNIGRRVDGYRWHRRLTRTLRLFVRLIHLRCISINNGRRGSV